MNKVTFYHMAEKILYAIYTESFTEKELTKIIEEETKKRMCWDIVYEETKFLNNLLKKYPWYAIPSLIKRLNAILSDNQNRPPSIRVACDLIPSILEDLDFKIKERIKTVICINISQCLLLYYKSAGAIEYEKLTGIMKKNFEFTETLTNAEIAEPEEYTQISLFGEVEKPEVIDAKEKPKSEKELREMISIANTEQKLNWFNDTKQAMKKSLDRNTLENFKNIILKICEEIKESQKDSSIYEISFEVINYLYESTLCAWKKSKKTKKNAPLLYLNYK